MSIEKRNDGYCVRWRDSTGKQRSQQVRLWRDAVTLDGEMKRKKAMGELVTHERGNITLAEFWDVWWQRYALSRLAPNTRDNYERLWRNHVKPVIGRRPLRSITREHADEVIARLQSKGRSPNTIRLTMAVLQRVLQLAVDWQYVPTNAAQGVRRPRIVKHRAPTALTPAAVAALAKEFDLRGRAIVLTLAGTGMRPGELRTLSWELIRDDRITVQGAKTNTLRSVEPMGFVLPALRAWHLASGAARHFGVVFPDRSGNVWTPTGYRMWQRNVFAPSAARAGFPGLVPYDLRHTFASQRIAEGWDVFELARQLGHSPTMTLTVYAHLLGGKSVYSERAADTSEARIPRARRGI